MNTMYEHIKNMSMKEMREFIYWVYMCGNKDGKENLCDTYDNSYFGGMMLTMRAESVINDMLEDFN